MAKVKSFRAEAGLSVDIKGVWYKFYTAIEIDLEPGDDTEKVKEMAWNTVHKELEKQVTEVTQA